MSIRGSLEVQSGWENWFSGVVEPGLKTVVGVGYLIFQATEEIVRVAVSFCEEAPKTPTTQKVTTLAPEHFPPAPYQMEDSGVFEREKGPSDDVQRVAAQEPLLESCSETGGDSTDEWEDLGVVSEGSSS